MMLLARIWNGPWWGRALAAASGGVLLVAMTQLMLGSEPGFDTPLAPLLGLGATLGFAVVRPAPLLTLIGASAACFAWSVTDQPGGPIYLTLFGAVAALGAQRPTRTWLPWSLATVASVLAAQMITADATPELIAPTVLLLATPKLVADGMRARRMRHAELEARALAAEQEAGRRIAEERLRIAREVHDVVGHGLATIALRAGVADRVSERDPAEVGAALRAIRQLARESLADVSALLGVLRRDDGAAERAPVPGLAALPELVATLRESGLAIALELDPALERDDGVTDAVGAAGYRIAQEALTNVVRHAGDGARAQVRVVRDVGWLEIEIADDGADAPVEPVAGGGLTGMRERAVALGGRFHAGRSGRGGFRVAAALPLEARP